MEPNILSVTSFTSCIMEYYTIYISITVSSKCGIYVYVLLLTKKNSVVEAEMSIVRSKQNLIYDPNPSRKIHGKEILYDFVVNNCSIENVCITERIDECIRASRFNSEDMLDYEIYFNGFITQKRAT